MKKVTLSNGPQKMLIMIDSCIYPIILNHVNYGLDDEKDSNV